MLIRDTNIRVDRDRCIACGICVQRCIMDNLRLSVAPCRQSCPLHINCQGFIRLIAEGKERLAGEALGELWPFWGVLGLFCHAPCERACARKKVDGPVNIRALQRYLAENELKNIEGARRHASERQTGKKVAIWGSGPAAMMAAWRLSRSGHQTVMFETENEPGGFLRHCDPPLEVRNESIRALVEGVTAAGVELKIEAHPGKSVVFDELLPVYDAVIITYKNDEELLWILDQKSIDDNRFQFDPNTLQALEHNKVFFCREFSPIRPHLVAALAIGKTASESVHRYVSGMPLMWERGFWHANGYVKAYAAPYDRAKHVQPECIEPIGSGGAQEETVILRSYSKEEAIFEAQRCLGCGRPFDHNHTCWYCLPCEIECPHDAIEVRIPYLLR